MPVDLYRQKGMGYNAFMPKPKRDAGVTIKVTRELKEMARAIAAAMTTDEVKWTETDAWEQGIQALAARKDVREALIRSLRSKVTDS